MTLEAVHNKTEFTLLKCISGSRAYGLDTETSDTDIRGVFFMPKPMFYGFDHATQVANETNDIVYYELSKFLELLTKNNPNILELLNTPEECILHRHSIIDRIKPELFLSKLCEQSFAGYAATQIKKAYGLNKKIFNPVDKERKEVIDFCFVITGGKTQPLSNWLLQRGYRQEECGVAKIAHAKDLYALYHASQGNGLLLNGISSGHAANDVTLSSVPIGIKPIAIMSFNKDGYSVHCKDHREYWVEKRNDTRYSDTLKHGKNYDAKNMMHTFRLLNIAEEIASEKRVNVKRHDREFLLGIKRGIYTYEQLMAMADEKMERVKAAFQRSDLPEVPNRSVIEQLLVEMRMELYKEASI